MRFYTVQIVNQSESMAFTRIKKKILQKSMTISDMENRKRQTSNGVFFQIIINDWGMTFDT